MTSRSTSRMAGCLVAFVSICLSTGERARAGDPKPPDVSGTWAQVAVSTAVSELPVLGDVETVTRSYHRLKKKQKGRDVRVEVEMCRVKIEPKFDQVRPVLPDAWLTVGSKIRHGRLVFTKNRWEYRQARHTEVYGAKMKDPKKGTLPTSPDDPRVIDEDKDGHPGMTVRIVGVVDGESYVVQRNVSALTGIVEGDHIDGLVQWRTQQNVIGASSMLFDHDPGSKPHSNPRKHFFRTTRIDSDVDCEEIVERKDELFRR